mmetsp:Transcript_15039/g.22161  ORF Transcript_15039/g.22161 Transcript_15039/m.22161 type:complete len:459 (-) Transcript_15039:204-1580(-)|eukprot:CAMPEP_0195520582 /NCGR_PEP_ID=MMETSP0794_2-20130614/17196_1 /TAXON_ID=515487 /ORGANISM="Stephanopyxis turris, Strain CCMP 815" /LENGTH=458 /DNA_ID=CAMNT_0040649967 /DNA_START=133 /DNA_END=1509 /DNA_ORIENTATION=+
MPPNRRNICDTSRTEYNETPLHGAGKTNKTEWKCPSSVKSRRTINPIRFIVDPIASTSIKCGKERGDGKDQISLALGDPTVYNNLKPCPVLIDAASKCATSRVHAGYVNACGSPEARAAIAKYYSIPEKTLSPDDVVLASGCSGALELALTTLLDEGSTLLVPRPGFPLYQVIAESHGAKVKHYNLDPTKNWECDIHHMEELVKQEPDSVRAIVINNPSNPCGSVFSKEHLREILKFSARHHLPIVSDEVYDDVTFHGSVFCPLGHVAAKMEDSPPVISASGLAKQFLVPGWRVGWLTFYDNTGGALKDVKAGVTSLAQVLLGASHITQGCVQAVLDPQSGDDKSAIIEWKSDLNAALAAQSVFTYKELQKCHGLSVIPSSGAMYAMVQIHVEAFNSEEIRDDLDFTRLLLQEENVFTLPGTAFGAPNFFRVVYCASTEVLGDAFHRIANFCSKHCKK